MKTPKEKAKELVERFMEYSHTEFISYRGGYQLDTQIQNAKQCALIAVDEILKDLKESLEVAEYLHPQAKGLIMGSLVNWQEVKTEIQAL